MLNANGWRSCFSRDSPGLEKGSTAPKRGRRDRFVGFVMAETAACAGGVGVGRNHREKIKRKEKSKKTSFSGGKKSGYAGGAGRIPGSKLGKKKGQKSKLGGRGLSLVELEYKPIGMHGINSFVIPFRGSP